MLKDKKKREENFFKRNYRQSWNYIKECKFQILFIFLTIIVGIGIGYLFPVFFQDFITNFLKELTEKTKGFDARQMILFILENNLKSSFLALIIGAVFGIFPVISALFNGYLIGFVVRKTAEAMGLGIIWNLVPHGIFEFPAVIVAMGMGVKLASFILAKNKKKQFFYDLENSLRVFLFVVIPFLIIAAVIEGILIVS